MDRKLYPNASQVYPAADLLATPVLTDVLSLIRDNESEKFLSIVNLVTKLAKLGLAATTYTASGAIDPNIAMAQLSLAGGLTMTIAAPVANQFMVITQVGAGTHTVTIASGDFDGTNEIATFNAAEETLILFGLSATRYAIIVNVGSVSLSAA